MNLIFPGTGGLGTLRNFQACMVIQDRDINMLIDCGTDAKRSLDNVGLNARDVDTVYLTHQHSDHIGGLEWLGFATYFDKIAKRPIVVAEDQLMDQIRASLVGMDCVGGKDTEFTDFFYPLKFNVWEDDPCFVLDDALFEVKIMKHIIGMKRITATYGIMFEDVDVTEILGRRSKIFYTGDACVLEDFSSYENAGLIIHDCETSDFHSGVHAHYAELRELPIELKSKMLLTHYGDNVLGNMEWWNDRAHMDGFKRVGNNYGFIPQGHVLTLKERL